MRIDLIITELPMGGAERCLTEVAIGLHGRGHDVRVLVFGPLPPPPRDGLVQRLRIAAVPLFSAQTASTYMAPLAWTRIRRLLREDPPDLVQTFLFHANVLGTAAALAAGVSPIVGGVRVAQQHPWRLRIERAMVRRMQCVTCVSQSVAAFAQQHLRVPAASLHVIPNAVDVERFAGAQRIDWQIFDLPASARVVLFVGRMEPQKGLKRLFAAAQRFLQSDPEAFLVMVGDGPRRRWCVQQCERLPGGRGRVLPWQADVAPLLAAAEMLILSSRYEGMPNVVLEAMAAGTAVACSEVEGVAELLGENKTRQVTPPGDAEALAKNVAWLLAHPGEARRLGEANQRRAAEHYTIEAMVDRYEQLYENVLEQARDEAAK